MSLQEYSIDFEQKKLFGNEVQSILLKQNSPNQFRIRPKPLT